MDYAQTLSAIDIPVLSKTSLALAQMHGQIDFITTSSLSKLFSADPFASLRALRAAKSSLGSKSIGHELETVPRCAIHMGFVPFFDAMLQAPVLQKILPPKALIECAKTVSISQNAYKYAFRWSIMRQDLAAEETATAALLINTAELMLWLALPQKMLAYSSLKQARPTERSSVLQFESFGTDFFAIQQKLIEKWSLPAFIGKLMAPDPDSDDLRLKTAQLACALARHSKSGWDNPALPDDFKALETLIHLDHNEALRRMGIKVSEENEQS